MTTYIIRILCFLLLLLCPAMDMAAEENSNLDTQQAFAAGNEQSDEQDVARAEQLFAFVLEDQADSLYENMSDKVKPMVQKQQFKGILKQLEPAMGTYQKHEPWEVQELMGQKCYVSAVQFEKDKAGVVIVFDEQRKMLGIQFVPTSAIKKE